MTSTRAGVAPQSAKGVASSARIVSRVLGAERLDVLDHLASELAGSRGAGGDGDASLPFQHLWLEVVERFDADRGAVGELLRDLYEAVGVVAARVADDDGQIGADGHRGDGLLAHLGGAADLVVDLDLREARQNRRMSAAVSHWLSVVCVVTASFSACAKRSGIASRSASVSTRQTRSGASPITPSGSGWPFLPM